jgi:ethanolamine utilization protein EutN
VDAGTGDPVLVLDEGNGARQIVASTDAPVRSVIVGIVDAVTT